MTEMTSVDSPFAAALWRILESLGPLGFLVLILVAIIVARTPKRAPLRARVALAAPILVPLTEGDAAAASHVLGSLAADVMASEDWQ